MGPIGSMQGAGDTLEYDGSMRGAGDMLRYDGGRAYVVSCMLYGLPSAHAQVCTQAFE